MRSRVAALALCATTAAAGAAAAHPVRAYVSPSGLDFLETQLPSYVPTRIEPPPLTETLFTCPGDRPVTMTQRDTVIDIQVDAFDLALPAPDVLRVDLTASVFADGEAYLTNPYACFGYATCQDSLSLWGGRFMIDFALTLEDGRPKVSVSGIDVIIDNDDLQFSLSGCSGIDDIVNYVVDLGKELFLQNILDKLEVMAAEQIGPEIEKLLGGFTEFSGNAGPSDYAVVLDQLAVGLDGIRIGADADVVSEFPAAVCVGEDPGDPGYHAGDQPDLAGGAPGHVGVAVNLGLIDDVLHHVWRSGLVCLTERHLEALGVHIPFEHVAELLPGFPPGTTFTMSATLARAPRIRAEQAATATLSVLIQGIEVALYAKLPDGSSKTLALSIDASASAAVALDPATNALVARIGTVRVDRLEMTDATTATEVMGLDLDRLRGVLADHLLPKVLGEIGDLPITGSIFAAMDGYYLLLRELRTTDAFLVAKADLFRAPTGDTGAPETQIVDQPGRVVRPDQARLVVAGTDAEVPAELLRYRVSIDGVAGEPGFMTALQVGEAGVSKTYRVMVRAIDLADNEDPTPALADVIVDGVRPVLRPQGESFRRSETGVAELAWTATDDLTEAGQLRPRVDIYRVPDDQDLLSAELEATEELAAGATSASLALPGPGLYKLVLVVSDEAGNEDQSSVLFTVTGAAAGCACQTGGAGGTGSGASLALLALGVAFALRRRRA